MNVNPLYFDRYVFDRNHPIPEDLDLSGAIAFNRDEKHVGSLHRILFLCQKVFYSLFRRGADANMTHGWVCLGRDPEDEQKIVKLQHGIFKTSRKPDDEVVVGHGVFTGIKTGKRAYLKEPDVTETYVYIPKNEELRNSILHYSRQTVFNARPDKLSEEQQHRVEDLLQKFANATIDDLEKSELLKLSLIDIQHNESTIVFKTQPGCADFVNDCLQKQCAGLLLHSKVDSDNSILIIPRSEKNIHKITENLKTTFLQEKLKFSISDMIKSCFHVTRRAKDKKMKRTALAIADLLQGEQVRDRKGRPRSLFCTPYVMMITQASLIINEMSGNQKARIQNMGREEAAAKIFSWLNSDTRSLGKKFKENEIWQFNFRFGMTGDAVQLLNKFSELREV